MSGNKKIKINRRLGNPITTLVLSLDSSNLNSYLGSGTNWYDLTTKANNVSFVNEPTFDSGNSGVIVFDGNNYGTINDNLSLEFVNGMFTVEIWIKFSELRGYQGIISKPGYSDGNGFMLYLENNNTITAVGGDNGWQVIMLSNIVPVLNKWYHLVVTKSNLGVWSLYINDSEQSIGDVNNTTFTFPDNDTNMYIGTYTNFPGYSNQPANNLYGSIGKVRIWKGYCMSPTIVSVNYSIGSIRFSNTTTTTTTTIANGSKIKIDGVEYTTSLMNGATYDTTTDIYTFDGQDDYSVSNDDISFDTSDFTISWWEKPNLNQTSNVIRKFGNISNGGWAPNNWVIGQSTNNDLVFYIYNDNNWPLFTVSITPNVWQNIVITRLSNIWKVFINGVESSSVNSSVSLDGGYGKPFYIGTSGITSEEFWGGSISDIEIYNTSLTSSDILNNYNNNKSNYVSIVSDGLVLNLDAGNSYSYNGTGTTWTDLSGYGNNGTLLNGVSFNSLNEGSLVFDGNDDSIEISDSNSISITGDMTINCWLKVDNYDTYRGIVSKVNSNIPNPFDLYLGQGNGFPSFTLGDGSGTYYFNGSVAPQTGVWQNITITLEGDVVTYYLNSEFSSSGTLNGAPSVRTDNGGPLYIGYRPDGVTKMLGNIACIHIYNRALSSSEVLQNYNELLSRFVETGKIEIDGVEYTTSLMNGATYDTVTGIYTVDGNDDYAVLANTPKPTTELSIGAWVNANQLGGWRKAVCFPYGENSWSPPYFSYQIAAEGTNLSVGFSVDSAYETGSIYHSGALENTWYYVVGTFNNGIIKMYVNGELVDTKDVTSSGTNIIYTNQTNLMVGLDAEYFQAEQWNGQIGDVEVYTTVLSSTDILDNFDLNKSNYGFTTTTTTTNNNSQNNYSLILNFEGNFEDNSGNNLVPTVIGNPTFSSDSVLGSGSMLIESSGDGLSYTSNSLFNFGNGDFTIETWVKFSNTDDSQALFTNYSSWDYSSIYFGRHPGTNGKVSVWCYDGTNLVTLQEVEMTTNQWIHYALVKNGTSLVLYKNGINVSNTSITSTSWSSDFSAYVGFAGDNPGGYGLIGNLDSYKISKVVRYTSNFTPEGYVEPITTTTTTTTAAPTTTTTTTTSTGSLILNLDAGNISSYPGTGTTWTDLTNTYTGISLVNGALYNSDGGGNILLDGVNDYIDLGLIGVMPNKNKFTFNTVYRFDKSKGGNAIFSTGTSGGSATDILFAHDGNVFFFQINNGSDGSAVANYTYTSNTWVNICVVYDGTQAVNSDRLKVYFNGVQNALSFGGYTVPASTPNYNYQSYLGKYVSFGGWDLKGNIAIARLHNYALSSAEVSSFYTSIQSRF